MTFEVRQTEEFAEWLDSLSDPLAQKAIAKRLVRIAGGLLGDIKPVGDGVSEIRVHTGPGHRLYLTRVGGTIVLLLCGGDKSSQRRDISKAKELSMSVRRIAAKESDQ